MSRFPMFSRFFATLPRIRASRSLLAAAAIAAVAIPGTADAARRVGGAYDGTWTTVFATTRGNCSSGYSVPFLVSRQPGLVGRRRPGLRLGRPRRQRRRGGLGRCLARQRRRAAGRQFRFRPLERHHHRRPLQRHLAGDAQLTFKRKRPARSSDGPFRFSADRRLSAAPAPSRPGGPRISRPARPWRTRRRRPSPCPAVWCRSPGAPFRGRGSAR